MKKYPRLQLWWRLQRHIAIWFTHLGLYVFALLFIFTRPQSSIFWIEGGGISPYVNLVVLVWFGVLSVHGGRVLLTYIRTRAVLREMEREEKQQHELDLLQLKIELARAKNAPQSADYDSDYDETEKPKRIMRLGDDGELIADNEINASDNHVHNRRR